MDILSVRPLRTASIVWQPKPGAWTFTAIAKLTFELSQGECPLAPQQEDPHEEDGYWDDDPSRSLRFASDLAPVKTSADILVTGSAYAPGGVPQRSFVARFRVGDVERMIEAHADRAISPDGTIHEGAPIVRMPLLYERARGGSDTWNPVGLPKNARDAHGYVMLPNLTTPGVGLDAIEPEGFGPIAPTWPGRRARLGRHGAPNLRTPGNSPLPWGFDLGFFSAAPPEQQAHTLRDDERIFLYNLSFEHAHMSTRLPAVRPRAFIDRGGNVPQPLAMRPDTLAIDTDRNLCTLVFRGHFPMSQAEEKGRVLVAPEHGGDHLGWAEVVSAVSSRLGAPRSRRPPMPSVSSVSPAPQPVYPIADEQSQPLHEDVVSMTLSDQDVKEVLVDTLPFAATARASRHSIVDARESRPTQPGLPFVTPGGPVPPGIPVPPLPSAPVPPPPVSLGSGRLSAGVPPPPPSNPGLVQPPPPPSNASGGVVMPAPPPSTGPILRSLGPDSPWASGAPGAVEQPVRATIGTMVAAQSAQAEPAPVKDTAQQNAVLRASNAAAAKTQSEPLAEVKQSAPSTPAAQSAQAVSAPSGDSRPVVTVPMIDVFDLLWYDRTAMPRIRKNNAWRAILRAVENRPADPDLDDAALGLSVAEVEDRRDVFELLARAQAENAVGIEDSLSSAIRPDGKVVAPLILAAGDLEFPFDEVEVLKAHVAIISPLASGDDKLKTELSLVRDFLASPELSCAPPMVEALSNRLWEAFSKAKRAVPAETLKQHAASMLLQKRRFQKREVFGNNHLRALLHAGQGGGPFPSYLPASLTAILPMFQKFRVRLFAEVHMAVDQHESCSTALRVLALVRVMERVRKVPPAAPAEAPPAPSPKAGS